MAQAAIQKTLVIYQDENGNEPFTDWLNKLRDQKGPAEFWQGWGGWSKVIMETASR